MGFEEKEEDGLLRVKYPSVCTEDLDTRSIKHQPVRGGGRM